MFAFWNVGADWICELCIVCICEMYMQSMISSTEFVSPLVKGGGGGGGGECTCTL